MPDGDEYRGPCHKRLSCSPAVVRIQRSLSRVVGAQVGGVFASFEAYLAIDFRETVRCLRLFAFASIVNRPRSSRRERWRKTVLGRSSESGGPASRARDRAKTISKPEISPD